MLILCKNKEKQVKTETFHSCVPGRLHGDAIGVLTLELVRPVQPVQPAYRRPAIRRPALPTCSELAYRRPAIRRPAIRRPARCLPQAHLAQPVSLARFRLVH